jgi:DNA-directed RNA polymerase specialized sigma24 family protein
LVHKNRPTAVVLVEDVEAVDRARTIELDIETPETVLIAQDDATLLEAAIASLPALLCETLVLREIRELGSREIAKITGASIATVMSRLARARRRAGPVSG